MPIDPKKCCGMHSKKREEDGECCQQAEQENAEGECTNCDCGNREEDSTYEGGGVVIDDTGECESCQ